LWTASNTLPDCSYFDLISKRSKVAGKNARLDVHGNSARDRMVRLFTNVGVEAVGRCWKDEEIVAQLGSEEINQERLKVLIAERRSQMDEFIDLALARLAEFHKTLTPEQRAKLVAKIETFKKWHGDSWE